MMSQPALPANQPTEDSLWYYEIGGAQVVPRTLNADHRSLTVAGSLQLGLGYSCGKLDPVLGVAETLNQVKTGAEDMLRAMTDAATGAIASLPALILQRANPGLYELMQNALIGAKVKVDLATKNCRQMEADIAQGENPYHQLIVLSKGTDWQRQLSIGGNNAIYAQQEVDAANGDNGVPWVLGKSAGGKGQPSLDLTGDVVQAGYNVMLNRATEQTAAAPTSTPGNLKLIWPTPQDAKSWISEVVGEQVVTTCDKCPKSSVPGQGLLPSLFREADALTPVLDILVSTAAPPTLASLAQLSAPNLVLTREVVEALRELPLSERQIVQARLVNDIAVGRTLEKAFYARRLLLSGKQLPEVVSNTAATHHIEDAIAELDAETDRLVFEYRTRQQIVSDTVASLLKRVSAMRNVSRGIPELGPIDERPLVDGRVVR